MLFGGTFRKQTGVVIPTVNVVTDYCLHPLWMNEDVDKYYVAAPELKEMLISHHVKPEDVLVTGIPVKKRFEEPLMNKNEAKTAAELSINKKVILFLASSASPSDAREFIQAAHNSRTNIYVVTGKNDKLKKQLEAVYGEKDGIIITGFVSNMDILMKLADAIVTKPGGLTLTEALNCNVPLILLNPVPGQEKENALFFEAHGSARIAQHPVHAAELCKDLLSHPNSYSTMKQNLTAIKIPDSAGKIAFDVCCLIDQPIWSPNPIIVA
jgi:processive 1,2-diacylglycerol beta-glucosyltransferase